MNGNYWEVSPLCWGLPCQSLIKKVQKRHGHVATDGANSLTQASSSQMTLVCLNLTKTKHYNLHLFLITKWG